jgi:hypothetical protein
MRHVPLALSAALLLPCAAGRLAAQQQQVEAHASWARTTQSNQNSWGGGAQYQVTWGAKTAPVQVGTSVAGDYMKQEHGGPSQTSASLDVTLQPGGGGALTPYAGGSVSENWLSGGGAPSGAKLGLQYIVGVQWKPAPKGPLALQLQLRPGYVHTQEHSVTLRLGLSSSV